MLGLRCFVRRTHENAPATPAEWSPSGSGGPESGDEKLKLMAPRASGSKKIRMKETQRPPIFLDRDHTFPGVVAVVVVGGGGSSSMKLLEGKRAEIHISWNAIHKRNNKIHVHAPPTGYSNSCQIERLATPMLDPN